MTRILRYVVAVLGFSAAVAAIVTAGGRAGLLFAAAAVVLTVLVQLRLRGRATGDAPDADDTPLPAPPSPESEATPERAPRPLFRRRPRRAELEADLAERDEVIERMRRELGVQRVTAQERESALAGKIAELEAALEAERERLRRAETVRTEELTLIESGLRRHEQELGALEATVAALTRR